MPLCPVTLAGVAAKVREGLAEDEITLMCKDGEIILVKALGI